MIDRTITLIRHGKTKGNYEKRYVGITDEPMTTSGKKEILSRSYPEADIVFTSPLFRCKQTASIIYPNTRTIVVNDLRETNFGAFEGKNYLELSEDVRYQTWIDSNGEASFPEGESKAEATVRFLRGYQRVLDESKDYKNVSVIAHGGTIMAILSHIFGGDYYSYHIENGEGYTFDLSSSGVYSGIHFRSFLG